MKKTSEYPILYFVSFILTICCILLILRFYPDPFSFRDDPYSDFGTLISDDGHSNIISYIFFVILCIGHSILFFRETYYAQYYPRYKKDIILIEQILCFLMGVGFIMIAIPKDFSDVANDIHRFGGFFTINVMLVFIIIKETEVILLSKRYITIIALVIILGMFTLFYTNYALEFIPYEKMMQNISISVAIISFWMLPLFTYHQKNVYPFGYFETEKICEEYENLKWTTNKCNFIK